MNVVNHRKRARRAEPGTDGSNEVDTYAAHTLLSLNRPLQPIAIPELLPQLQPPPFTNPVSQGSTKPR